MTQLSQSARVQALSRFAEAFKDADYELMMEVWREGMKATDMKRATQAGGPLCYKEFPDFAIRATFLRIGLEFTSKKPAQEVEHKDDRAHTPLTVEEMTKRFRRAVPEMIELMKQWQLPEVNAKPVVEVKADKR